MTVLVAVVLLAAVNGANDVANGVATLAGSRVSSYRVAVGYGTVTTLVGSLAAVWLGGAMHTLFTSGIVEIEPTDRFALAVLAGTGGWVGLATILRLPVSTTHALVGALLGAGLIAAPHGLRPLVLAGAVALPLLASVAAAYLLSAGLAARSPVARLRAVLLPVPRLPALPARAAAGLHWLSAGAVGAARGLNDTPKIAAVAGFALLPAGVPAAAVVVGVAVAMVAGSWLGGVRVARRLGDDVVALTHRDGLGANLTTAALVGPGAALGLPMSTTQVSTGAIAGVAGVDAARLNLSTLWRFLLGWTLTPAVAGGLAAGSLIAGQHL